MAKMGRPPEAVPQAIADALLAWLYEGKSLLSFCRQPGMPKRQTIDDWKAKDADFASRFARAREASADVLVDEAQAVADDGRNDTYTDEDGNVRTDHDVIARSRLRVDTLLKRAACYDPRRYGTKVGVDHAGGVSLNVVTGLPKREEAVQGAEVARNGNGTGHA